MGSPPVTTLLFWLSAADDVMDDDTGDNTPTDDDDTEGDGDNDVTDEDADGDSVVGDDRADDGPMPDVASLSFFSFLGL